MKSIQFPSVAPYLINSCLYVLTLRDTPKNHTTSARDCLPQDSGIFAKMTAKVSLKFLILDLVQCPT